MLTITAHVCIVNYYADYNGACPCSQRLHGHAFLKCIQMTYFLTFVTTMQTNDLIKDLRNKGKKFSENFFAFSGLIFYQKKG